MKKLLLAFAFVAAILSCAAENITVQPQFWWTGMKNRELQIIIHGTDISKYSAQIASPLIESAKEKRTSNPNYLFVYVTIAENAVPGSFDINLKSSDKKLKPIKLNYALKAKENQKRGFDASDLMCLVMPDRFSNGNPNNDNMPGMLEKADNTNPNGRHGGDIQGIINLSDYIKSMGITAVWINPMLENNMPAYSYHGYAISDFYKTDSRFGTDQEYRNMSQTLHKKNIKLVMDLIFNHCATENLIYKDLVDSTWFHFFPQFTRSNFRGTTVFDPHASQYDKNLNVNGWFDSSMADFDQTNDMCMTYLIQCSIWWTEYLGLDAIRMDTYPYNDKIAMNKWADALHNEFPDISLLGECWLNDNPYTLYFTKGVKNPDGFECKLDHVTDFPLSFAISKAFNENEGWDTGINRVYASLVSDYLNPDPLKNLIFVDNHDLDRIATVVNGDLDKLKMIYTLLLTTRGTPCLYYGSEVMMTSGNVGDGWRRQNFPGGFPGDKKNAVTGENLLPQEADLQAFVKKLALFRKDCDAFCGKLIHWIPQNGVYTYFRIGQKSTVMVMINSSDKTQTIDTECFNECLSRFSKAVDIISDKEITDLKTITINKKSSAVFVLK